MALLRYVSFSKWQDYLVACFLVYLAGFYLAPTNEFQLRWFYYTITIIAGFMFILKGKAVFSGDDAKALRWVALLSFLLFVPFLWTPDSDYVRTVRNGGERLLFVLSLALAVSCSSRKPELLEKWLPSLLLCCASIAVCFVFYNAIDLGVYQNVVGWLVLSANPNQTGLAMGVASVLCLSMLLAGELRPGRCVLWSVAAAIFALALFLSTARSGWLGLLMAVTCLLYMRLHSKWLWAIPLVCAALIVTYTCQIAADPLHYLLSGREEIWGHIWNSFRLHPWFGQGAQQTYDVIRLANGTKLEAHSLYFGIAYYAGLYGLSVFCVLLLFARRQGGKSSAVIRWYYFPLLVYGLTVVLFEGIYPIYVPSSFWLYTWLPLLILILAEKPNNDGWENGWNLTF